MVGAVGYTDYILLNECPGYDTKPFDGEALVLQELLGVWITPSLPLPQGPLSRRVVILVRVQSMGQIEQFILETICVQIEIEMLNSKTGNHLTVCKQWITILETISVEKN